MQIDDLKNDIKAINVSKSFGKNKILDNLEFSLFSGKVYGLLAPNGWGKSTLMKSFINLIKIEGRICWNDIKVSSDFNHEIIYSPSAPLFDNSPLTFKEYVKLVCYLKQVSFQEFFSKILRSELRDLVETKDISKLSTGQKKIFQIALDSMTDPKVLILDEPFNGLDQEFRSALSRKIEDLKRKGKIIIISTHVFQDLEGNTNDIMVLNSKRIFLEFCENSNDIKKIYAKHFGFLDNKEII